jgi:hypothetical protein
MMVLLAFLLVGITPSVAATTAPSLACLRYEPDTVRLTGRLVRRTFYGAPGYGENPKHDEKETGCYLELRQPVCTMADRYYEAKTSVRLIQLVLDSAGYARLRSSVGKSVTLRGTLFAAFTGHHHAPILLTVVSPSRGEH